MTQEGQMAFSLKTENKTNIYSNEQPVSLSVDYKKQFQNNKIAWEFFTKQAPSYQKGATHWIMSAKQEKTRQSRLEKTITESEKQKRVN